MRVVLDPSLCTSQIILNLLTFKSNSGPVTAEEMIFVKHADGELHSGFVYYNAGNERYCNVEKGPHREDVTVIFRRYSPIKDGVIDFSPIIYKHATTINLQHAADWIEAYIVKGDLPEDCKDTSRV